MRTNWRTVLILILITSVIVSITSFFILRVPENQVTVHKMIRFHEVMPDSERILTDREAVKQFTYAVRFANKDPGMVDIEDPPFQFTLEGKPYYLWVSERFRLGTLMKLPNTGTTYTISESRAENLLNILDEIYNHHER